MMPNNSQSPPKHLSAAAKRLFASVVEAYVLEPHHVAVLEASLEAWDRMTEARKTLAAEGAVYYDRFNAPRKHPAVSIEQDARLAFMRGIRELGLDSGAVDDVRPPRLGIA